MNWVGSRSYGITLVALAAVLWSTGGLFIRAVSVDIPTMMAWRSMFSTLSLAAIFLVLNRRRPVGALRDLGWPGLIAIPISALSITGFVVSVSLTTVANVMIIYATVPFLAAGIAWAWMRERASRSVLVASGAALAGILVMAGSATAPGDLAGNAFALLMTATFAAQLVMARRYPRLQMVPVNAAGAALCALAFLPFAQPGIPPASELAILCAFGIVTTGGAYILFLLGGRYIPSAEAGLVGLLDVVLSPLWVWWAFGETPSAPALAGGAIVLAAVLWYLAGGLRAVRRKLV
jgi:drug/metabolite transporter (DMT)-like permease